MITDNDDDNDDNDNDNDNDDDNRDDDNRDDDNDDMSGSVSAVLPTALLVFCTVIYIRLSMVLFFCNLFRQQTSTSSMVGGKWSMASSCSLQVIKVVKTFVQK